MLNSSVLFYNLVNTRKKTVDFKAGIANSDNHREHRVYREHRDYRD